MSSTRYAETMHDWEVLRIPEKPLPPARTDPRLKWANLAVLAACAIVWGVLVYNIWLAS